MKKLLQGLVVLALVFGSGICFASNFSFLNNAPLGKLTSEDWKMIEDLSGTVLDSYPDNKKAAWENPRSKHHGTVEALNRYHRDGKVCRDMRFTSFTSFGKSSDKFVFCKYPNLGWKIPG
jgi:hypothetical protein